MRLPCFQSSLLAIAVLLGAAPGRCEEALDVPAAVVAALKDKVPEQILPVCEEFARETLNAMPQVTSYERQESDLVVRSIVSLVEDRWAPHKPATAEAFKQDLKAILDESKPHLAKLTNGRLKEKRLPIHEWWDKDWQAIRVLVLESFAKRPVLVLSMEATSTFQDTLDELQKAGKGRPTSEYLSKLAGELSFKHLQSTLDELVLPQAQKESLDSIFLIGRKTYATPISKEDKERIGKFLEGAFQYEGVAVLHNEVVVVCEMARRHMLEGAEIKWPERGGLKEYAGSSYRGVAPYISEAPALYPLCFGGKVPDAMRSGAAFGFVAKKKKQWLDDATYARKLDLNSLLNTWSSCISRKLGRDLPRMRDLPLMDKIEAEWFEMWKGKIMDLKEFVGEQEEKDLNLSEMETKWLHFLRKEQSRNPLFADTKKDVDERCHRFEKEFLGSGYEAFRKDYEPFLAEYAKWLEARYKLLATPQKIRTVVLRDRSITLWNFLAWEFQKANGIESGTPLQAAIGEITRVTWQKLEKTTAFSPEKLFPRPEYEKLTPVEKALYDYYKAATVENPVYHDLDRNLEHQELRTRYQGYLAKGRSKGEREAYEKAIAELKSALKPEQE